MNLINFNIDVESLNDTYYRIVDLIGADDAVRLSKALSGRQIRMKREFDLSYDYCEIVSCIGKEKSLKLIKGFPGENVYFSNIENALKTQIHNKICQEFNGYNLKELSERFGYTERHIRRIIKKARIHNG